MMQISGKRLTYSNLTGKVEETASPVLVCPFGPERQKRGKRRV